MKELTIKDLLEAGVHFGHQTRRWNPKMKKHIFSERNDIYIIDLKKTLDLINRTCDVVRSIVSNGDSVLFVGTKPQAAPIIREEAERSGQYYVINRWLGGMLTNYRTIRQSVKRLEHFEKMATDGTYELITKKEILSTEKKRDKLQLMLGGIREMNKIPGLLIVVDTKKENIAVREANRLGIPVCAIIDTNCDPDPINYPIPGNDDAIRSIKIILSQITDAILEGLHMREESLAEMEPKEEAKERPKRDPRRKEADEKTAQLAKTKPEGKEEKKAEMKTVKAPREKKQAEKKDETAEPVEKSGEKKEKAALKPVKTEEKEKVASKTVETEEKEKAASKPVETEEKEKAASKPVKTEEKEKAGKTGTKKKPADKKKPVEKKKDEISGEKADEDTKGKAKTKSAPKDKDQEETVNEE